MMQGNNDQAGLRSVDRRTGVQAEKDLAGHLFALLGVFQEYQSSAIALVRLRTAVVRNPHLASVLRPSLADMQRANLALRKEVMQMQRDIATRTARNPSHNGGAKPTAEQAPS